MWTLFITLFFSLNVFAEVSTSCGKMVNALLTVDPKAQTAIINGVKETEEEFCDGNINELFSNFDIQFLDMNKNVINTQSLYVNLFTIIEGSAAKNKKEMIFGNTKFLEDKQFRTLRYSLVKDRPKLVSYKIIRKQDQKVFGEGELK